MNSYIQSPSTPTPCRECGGARVFATCSMSMELTRPGTIYSTSLNALVCTACGHTSLYATNPAMLVSRKNREKPGW